MVTKAQQELDSDSITTARSENAEPGAADDSGLAGRIALSETVNLASPAKQELKRQESFLKSAFGEVSPDISPEDQADIFLVLPHVIQENAASLPQRESVRRPDYVNWTLGWLAGRKLWEITEGSSYQPQAVYASRDKVAGAVGEAITIEELIDLGSKVRSLVQKDESGAPASEQVPDDEPEPKNTARKRQFLARTYHSDNLKELSAEEIESAYAMMLEVATNHPEYFHAGYRAPVLDKHTRRLHLWGDGKTAREIAAITGEKDSTIGAGISSFTNVLRNNVKLDVLLGKAKITDQPPVDRKVQHIKGTFGLRMPPNRAPLEYVGEPRRQKWIDGNYYTIRVVPPSHPKAQDPKNQSVPVPPPPSAQQPNGSPIPRHQYERMIEDGQYPTTE